MKSSLQLTLAFVLGLAITVPSATAQEKSAFGQSFFKASTTTNPTNATATPTIARPSIPSTLPYESPWNGYRGGCDSSGAGCDGRGGCGGSPGCQCGDGGCDGRSSCNSGGCNNRLGRSFFSRFQHSEGCYDCFISPITNPIYFEDPRLMTESRGVFLQNRVPAALGGGAHQYMGIQIRARLSENVALVVNKAGFFTSSNPLIDDGWADFSAGLKFALIRKPETQWLTSAGFTFEIPSGEASALQGNGSGNLNLYIANGKRFNSGVAWIGSSGVRMPMDTVDESSVAYSSHQLSKNIGQRTWLLTEFNMQNWLGAGLGGIPGVEGNDLFNFGSVGVAGNTIVTNAVGLKFKPSRNQEFGAAFEYPLTERRDLIDNRIHVSWIKRF